MVFARKLELAQEKLRRAEDALRDFRSDLTSDYPQHKKLVEEVNSARTELLDLASSLWPEVKEAEPHDGGRDQGAKSETTTPSPHLHPPKNPQSR